ncbi:MAG: hypothetical protein Tsb0015_16820 [Simkaniaceae bacterium]
MSSIVYVLNNNLHGDYSRLFDPKGGFFIHEKKDQWSISRKPVSQSQRQEYFKKLALAIVKQGLDNLENKDEFIKVFNRFWTEARLPFKTTGNKGSSQILFNSKESGYEYLSNFFQTLIKINETIYPSAEHAYVIEGLRTAGYEGSIDKTLEPAEIKKISTAFKKTLKSNGNQGLSDQDRLSLMKNIVHEKFTQNTVLQELLIKTNPLQLIEKTKDAFWGCGPYNDAEESKIEMEICGSNHLGEILMRVRDSLSVNISAND